MLVILFWFVFIHEFAYRLTNVNFCFNGITGRPMIDYLFLFQPIKLTFQCNKFNIYNINYIVL